MLCLHCNAHAVMPHLHKHRSAFYLTIIVPLFSQLCYCCCCYRRDGPFYFLDCSKFNVSKNVCVCVCEICFVVVAVNKTKRSEKNSVGLLPNTVWMLFSSICHCPCVFLFSFFIFHFSLFFYPSRAYKCTHLQCFCLWHCALLYSIKYWAGVIVLPWLG